MMGKDYFSLFNESFRLDAQQAIQQVNIISIPEMKDEDRSEALRNLENRATDILDIWDDEDGYDPRSIKEFQGTIEEMENI